MIARLLAVWDQIRFSLWAVPLAMAALGAALALFVLHIDPPWVEEIAWLYSGTGAQAQEFASSLVGAMITLTTLAVSITMVVLTLAAQQLGPRLIFIFMGDIGTKLALGLFLGATVYLLFVLRALDGDEAGGAPALAISIGTALVLASLIALLVFVHQLARSIVADHVVARVGESLDRAIAHAFTPDANAEEDLPEGGAPVSLADTGYIQRIDYEALAKTAAKHDALIRLAYYPGAHVIDGEPHAYVLRGDTVAVAPQIRSAIVFASERGAGQDPEWSARQLVEIALRALSPGINDMFTAHAVIDRLTRSMARLMRCGSARRVWQDGEGLARVFGPGPTFDSMMEAAFDAICESGSRHAGVMLRLSESIAKLAALAEPRHARALARQITRTRDAARFGIADKADLAEIEARLDRARSAITSDN